EHRDRSVLRNNTLDFFYKIS
ncbi:hypothetical protein CP8484711_1032B, partial [Chlamydia psittaci 84-8471/1]